MSIFLLQQTFFCNAAPFSYMFFHSSYTNNLIELYSLFSAINHSRIYSNLMLLQCHVRKQIKFLFMSLSYKTVFSNSSYSYSYSSSTSSSSSSFFFIPRFLFYFQFPSPLTSFLSSLPLLSVNCGIMRSFLQNILVTPHSPVQIPEQLSISISPVSHSLLSPGDASGAPGPNQDSVLWLCDHPLLHSPR